VRPPLPASGLPVLVDRAEARAILGATESTFARLVREGRFRDATLVGPSLFHTRELLAYRRSTGRGSASAKPVTPAPKWPLKTKGKAAPAEIENSTGAGEVAGRGTDPYHTTCAGCGRIFRKQRADQRSCSSRCRGRLARAAA
jgi:hypothetical protein